MKKIFAILCLAILSILHAQGQDAQPEPNYSDSTITLTITQRFAFWLAKSIQITADTRKLPDKLQPYVGSATRPDSTFKITIKAALLAQGMELLISQPLLVAYDDYRAIMHNQPTVQGYTKLTTQINTLSDAGNGTAIWLREWFAGRQEDYNKLYNEELKRIIKLVN